MNTYLYFLYVFNNYNIFYTNYLLLDNYYLRSNIYTIANTCIFRLFSFSRRQAFAHRYYYE